MFINFLFPPENRNVYKVMWEKIMVQLDRPLYNTAHAHCMLITKATDIHTEYEILSLFHGNKGYGNSPQRHVCAYISCLLYLWFI
jgi:hypothetical protein